MMSISLTDFVDSVAGERIAELEEQVERAFKAGYAINILDAQTSDPDLLFKEWKAKAEGADDE